MHFIDRPVSELRLYIRGKEQDMRFLGRFKKHISKPFITFKYCERIHEIKTHCLNNNSRWETNSGTFSFCLKKLKQKQIKEIKSSVSNYNVWQQWCKQFCTVRPFVQSCSWVPRSVQNTSDNQKCLAQMNRPLYDHTGFEMGRQHIKPENKMDVHDGWFPTFAVLLISACD